MHKLAKNEPLSDIEVNSSSLMVSRIVVLLQRHYESTLGSGAIVQHISNVQTTTRVKLGSVLNYGEKMAFW